MNTLNGMQLLYIEEIQSPFITFTMNGKHLKSINWVYGLHNDTHLDWIDLSFSKEYTEWDATAVYRRKFNHLSLHSQWMESTWNVSTGCMDGTMTFTWMGLTCLILIDATAVYRRKFNHLSLHSLGIESNWIVQMGSGLHNDTHLDWIDLFKINHFYSLDSPVCSHISIGYI